MKIDRIVSDGIVICCALKVLFNNVQITLILLGIPK